MAHKPLRQTDKRRAGNGHNFRVKVADDGAGSPLADLFNDRRHSNGRGKGSSMGKAKKAA